VTHHGCEVILRGEHRCPGVDFAVVNVGFTLAARRRGPTAR
jgi:hypothetical protein